MKLHVISLCVALAAAPAAAQTHAKHTAAHDSAHAIMLDDAQHLALHQLLLGHWTGEMTRDGVRHPMLDFRFEEDSMHQMLMVRHQGGVTGFQIRGDTLSWNNPASGSSCVVTTPVSALLEATKAASKPVSVPGAMTCGEKRTALTLTKALR
jgi:hypothetical protein